MKNSKFFLAVFGIIGAIAFASPGIADSKSVPTAVPPADSSIKEKLTDSSFIEKATLNFMKDTELSKLALLKSQNKKLKRFSQQILDDSIRTIAQLKTIAATQRIDIPQTLNASQRQMISQVQQLSGEQFDATYVDLMKKAQDSNVGLYDNAAGESTLNVDLRVFANKQLPWLRKNQKSAHALSQPAASS